MIAYIEFDVDDDFKRGKCGKCPFSHYDKNNKLVCSMFVDGNHCEVKFRKGSDKNGKKN